MKLPVGSVVTSKTISEFDLLRKSIEQYHDCYWILSCDTPSYEKYSNEENIKCLNLIETDDCDHNVGDADMKDNWMKVMMTKFDVAKASIEKFGHVLFLDSDMVFVNPIEDKVLEIFDNHTIDAAICQHMTNDWQNEAQHGLYNGGMFHVKNLKFIESWRTLSENYKKYNFYFEQQPLEYVQRNFLSLNLPINYNLGWWRFNRPQTQQRLNQLSLQNDKIYIGDLPAVNFHVHTLRELEYQNFGQFLVDKLKSLFEQTSNKNYKELLSVLEG